MTIWLEHGDMRAVMRRLIDEKIAVDAIVTDPPYHLTTGKKGGSGEASLNPNSPAGRSIISTGFMGKQWDGGDIAFQADTWRLCYEILPPGGHLLAFGGTRTFHRLVCAIEDAGFEIRESLLWLYGTGFPKSLDVSKAVDSSQNQEGTKSNEVSGKGTKTVSALGDGLNVNFRQRPAYTPVTDAARQWQGWGTALKPACELICLARKPLIGTVAANVQAHGTGALNIDGCRIGTEQTVTRRNGDSGGNGAYGRDERVFTRLNPPGRWPANVCLSYPEDEYVIQPDATAEEKAELFRWLSENT